MHMRMLVLVCVHVCTHVCGIRILTNQQIFEWVTMIILMIAVFSRIMGIYVSQKKNGYICFTKSSPIVQLVLVLKKIAL